jgi:hypothetical protein
LPEEEHDDFEMTDVQQDRLAFAKISSTEDQDCPQLSHNVHHISPKPSYNSQSNLYSQIKFSTIKSCTGLLFFFFFFFQENLNEFRIIVKKDKIPSIDVLK